MGSLSSIFLNSESIKLIENLVYLGLLIGMKKEDAQKISHSYIAIMANNFKIKTLEPSYFCEVVLPVCKNSENKYKILQIGDYEKQILADKPDFVKDNNFMNNMYKDIQSDLDAGNKRDTILMYQFSDMHWNLEYTEGTSADCGEIVCCKSGQIPK